MAPVPVRFVDAGHVLMSDGWVVRGTHALPPPAQLFNLPSPLTRSSPRVHAASKLTTSTSLPKRNSVKPLVRKSSSSSKLGLRRGKQRWSALVAAPTSRLAGMMRERLGDAAWNAFVAHANEHYKDTYVRAFDADVLRCVGTVDGKPCPHAFEVDLAAKEAKAKLEFLHLDHERPVHLTCARWAAQLPKEPASWDDGLDGAELCHALFGVCDDDVHGARCVRFRCGPRRASGKRVCFAQHSYCHTS